MEILLDVVTVLVLLGVAWIVGRLVIDATDWLVRRRHAKERS